MGHYRVVYGWRYQGGLARAISSMQPRKIPCPIPKSGSAICGIAKKRIFDQPINQAGSKSRLFFLPCYKSKAFLLSIRPYNRGLRLSRIRILSRRKNASHVIVAALKDMLWFDCIPCSVVFVAISSYKAASASRGAFCSHGVKLYAYCKACVVGACSAFCAVSKNIPFVQRRCIFGTFCPKIRLFFLQKSVQKYNKNPAQILVFPMDRAG